MRWKTWYFCCYTLFWCMYMYVLKFVLRQYHKVSLICNSYISTAKSGDEEDFRGMPSHEGDTSSDYFADARTSSCVSFEVDSGRSDSEGEGCQLFLSRMILLQFYTGFIFIIGTFTAWECQVLNGIGDSYKLLVSFIKPSVKRKKRRKNWCLSCGLFHLGYIHPPS